MKAILLYNFCFVDLAMVPDFVVDDLAFYFKKFDKLMHKYNYKHGI